ncbi:MAG: alpha/beta hydrolase [Clostridiales bacterium]|nr:alpha/beta hydrolase [Clostridiales bacterium]
MPVWGFAAMGAALFLVLFSGACFFVKVVLRPPREAAAEALAREAERGAIDPGEFDAALLHCFSRKSFDGHSLRCLWLRAEGETKRAVVLAHGFGSRLEHMLKYARLYRKFGFDVLLYDHRNSGESEGGMTTMGHLEKRDLADMVRFAREDKGEGCTVGVHGESMGAVTALLCAAMGGGPDFVGADCPFASFRRQAAQGIRSFYVPAWLVLPLGRLVLRLRAGFTLRDVSPIAALEGAQGLPDIPILFVHGTGDALIPFTETQRLYEAKRGKKALFLAEGAGHGRSIVIDRAGYEAALFAFLAENGMAEND